MPRFLSIAETSSGGARSVHGVLTGPAYKRLLVTALPGIRPDGTLPEDVAAQIEQAFDNLANLLATAGLSRDDVVRLVVYLAAPGSESLAHLTAVARLGGMRPGVAVRQVNALSHAGHLIEIDLEAVREN